jgi:hypothetical protein
MLGLDTCIHDGPSTLDQIFNEFVRETTTTQKCERAGLGFGKGSRKKEETQKRQILFPIGLVDFNAIREWNLVDADVGDDLAGEIREYFIPDSSSWEDHRSYKNTFDRLLRDLRAAPRLPTSA